MDNREDALLNESEVRTCSASVRAGRTPTINVSVSIMPWKTAGRKKKKTVLVEVEVSDEEEVTDHADSKPKKLKPRHVELENSDNGNEVVEIQEFVSNQNNEIDNCSNTAQFPEESVRLTNELNSFKGAIVSTDRIDVSENNIQAHNVLLKEDTTSQQKELDTNEIHEDSKMDTEDEKNEVDNDKTEQMESVIKIEPETENLVNEESIMDQMNSDLTTDVQLPPQSMDTGDPDTEVISEELPGVQVARVSETEEVSDEELPRPKRAELPANAETRLKMSRNPFMQFIEELRIKKPGKPMIELTQLAGTCWETMSSKEKEPYIKLALSAPKSIHRKRGRSQNRRKKMKKSLKQGNCH